MPNDDFAMICPYYHKTLGNTVFCEGFTCDDRIKTENSYFKQCFVTRDERNKCFKNYCASFQYPRCRIAALNSAFLEQDKQQIGI